MKQLYILLFPLLLAGCAKKEPIPDPYANATVKYTASNTKADVIADLGVPSGSVKMSDTQTMYQWNSDNGSTSSGTAVNVSNSVGFASTDCIGCGFDGDSTTVGKTNSSGNVSTHVCHLSVVVDDKTDHVVSAKLGGTVDPKCYQHFSNAIIIDQYAVQRYNHAVENNANITKRRKILAIVGVLGGAGAIAASN
ncbi:hypothetical protein MUU48_00295 [Scandinavium sp. H11S7]|uniref:hypothetical protein n=1 Tax=Scandinavium hiltneri TaxID=2926519 RepID=UPI00216674A2|nr:hypothetical protein [Scandinavium hiltneri]MCS2155414.1 hypothetical protein [Scandinavium hiltneri]